MLYGVSMRIASPLVYFIDILQASGVTRYTRGSYSIRSRGAAKLAGLQDIHGEVIQLEAEAPN